MKTMVGYWYSRLDLVDKISDVSTSTSLILYRVFHNQGKQFIN